MISTISQKEFDIRLLMKLEQMSKTEMIWFIIKNSYEQICEYFNNEIITDYENDNIKED